MPLHGTMAFQILRDLKTGKSRLASIPSRIVHAFAPHGQTAPQPCKASSRSELRDERFSFEVISTVAPSALDFDDRIAEVPQGGAAAVAGRFSLSSHRLLRCPGSEPRCRGDSRTGTHRQGRGDVENIFNGDAELQVLATDLIHLANLSFC